MKNEPLESAVVNGENGKKPLEDPSRRKFLLGVAATIGGLALGVSGCEKGGVGRENPGARGQGGPRSGIEVEVCKAPEQCKPAPEPEPCRP